MFKLVSLLAAGMFLTLLIGGEDKGQMRQGLIDAMPAAERPVVREAKTQTPKPKTEVTLANFSPVTVQTPAAKRAASAKSAPVMGNFVIVEPEKTASLEVHPTVAAPEMANNLPVMYVSSRSVNVRGGPSTDHEVLGRLSRAEAVTVVSPEADGWVQIRIEGDGIEGYIAARLLSDTDPSN